MSSDLVMQLCDIKLENISVIQNDSNIYNIYYDGRPLYIKIENVTCPFGKVQTTGTALSMPNDTACSIISIPTEKDAVHCKYIEAAICKLLSGVHGHGNGIISNYEDFDTLSVEINNETKMYNNQRQRQQLCEQINSLPCNFIASFLLKLSASKNDKGQILFIIEAIQMKIINNCDIPSQIFA